MIRCTQCGKAALRAYATTHKGKVFCCQTCKRIWREDNE